jgi:hypothetical protein
MKVFNIGVAVSANLICVVASAALTMVNLYLRIDEIHHGSIPLIKCSDAMAWSRNPMGDRGRYAPPSVLFHLGDVSDMEH